MSCPRAVLAGLVSLTVLVTAQSGAQVLTSTKSIASPARANYGQVPLSFEVNRGQTDPQVQFVSRGAGYTVFLTSGGMVLALHPVEITDSVNTLSSPSFPAPDPAAVRIAPRQLRQLRAKSKRTPVTVTVKLVGAASNPKAVGEKLLRTQVNYFIGRNPKNWRTKVPTYARVRYKNIYPGIDLLYYGNNRQVEYDFVVASGADASQIEFSVSGADAVAVDSQGDLALAKGATKLLFRAPGIYQEVHGARVRVPGGYALKDSAHVGFTVAPHDNAKPLVIDPVLVYSTFLGGGGDDEGSAIAVDASGSAYITGTTDSVDFPLATLGSFGSTQTRMFLVKLDPSGSSLVFADYFGGSSGDDWPMGIALDSSGNPYVTGSANSTDFPVVNSYQANMAGNQDAFLTKFSADGSAIVYSTYLGGTDAEYSNSVAVDSDGEAIVAGTTYSQDFPLASAYQSSVSASQYGYWGNYGFVTKFSPDGSSLVYSSYLGGNTVVGNYACAYYCSPFSQINGIAVDATGNAYVVGNTDTSNFPVTGGSYLTTYPGSYPNSIGFVSKFTVSGLLAYATYLGGTGYSYLVSAAVDTSGSAYVTGYDDGNDNFPVTSTAICDPSTQGCAGVTVTKLDSSGASLLYSTYLETNNCMTGDAIQVDTSGDAFVLGNCWNNQISLTNPLQGYSGGEDAVVAEIDPTASTQLFATFLGGGQSDSGSAMALDTSGSIYVVGTTASPDFPTTPSAFQQAWGGQDDAFISKIGTGTSSSVGAASISPSSLAFPASVVGTTSATQSVTVTNTGSGTLTFNDVQVTSDFAATSSNCGVVTANSSCTVLVTFKPTSSGARAGTITFSDSAVDSPQTVVLGGSGIDFSFTATDTDATVVAGGTATYHLNVSAVGGTFPGPVFLTCSGAPAFASCTANPTSADPGSGSSSVTFSVATTGTIAQIDSRTGTRMPAAAWMSLTQGFGIVGVLFFRRNERVNKRVWLIVLAVLVTAIMLLTGCGGASTSSHVSSGSTTTPPGTYQLVVTGRSAGAQHSSTLTLTVR